MKVITVLFFLCIYNYLSAQILQVKQDGSGDFVHIQDAINASIDGDTILVFPGTFSENLVIDTKNICVGSLTMTTGDSVYTDQTIIDGNLNGSCVKALNISQQLELNGFKLINGSGSYMGTWSGGAIFSENSSILISNCHIRDNKVVGSGGGIFCRSCTISLSNNTISDNHAVKTGGGLCFADSFVVFDSINKSDIYLNYASKASDVYFYGIQQTVNFIVDTFTVLNPDKYYILHDLGYSYPGDGIDINVDYGKISQASQDLFVSSIGSDSNSGLTSDDPLKTISFALLKIASDETNKYNIHIENGIYSSTGGEKFPLNIKSHVNLIGENRDSVILDAESYTMHFNGSANTDGYSIRNLTICNGNGSTNMISGEGSIEIFENHDVIMENLLFRDNFGLEASVLYCAKSTNIEIRKCEFANNVGGVVVMIQTSHSNNPPYPPFTADYVKLESCLIHFNYPEYSTTESGFGGSVAVMGMLNYKDSLQVLISNSVIVDNEKRTLQAGNPEFSGILALFGANLQIVNSTIGGIISTNPKGGVIGVSSNSRLDVYNSIVYDNSKEPFYISNLPDYESTLNIYNSCVEGGENGINTYTSNYQLNYEVSNIEQDPLWDTLGLYPYSITGGSPCIDLGTTNLPEDMELPETDILGNPRIHNANVDMGAYEFGPWVGISKAPNTDMDSEVSVYPNPFMTNCYFRFQVDESGTLKLDIYDGSGHMVKRIKRKVIKGRQLNVVWNGKDDKNKSLPDGLYIIKAYLNELHIDSVKLIKSN